MKEIIRILIVRSEGRPIEGKKTKSNGSAHLEEPWHTSTLPGLFWMYFKKHPKQQLEITFARDEEEAVGLLSADSCYDFVVFVHKHLEALFRLIVHQSGATPVIVHERESKLEVEENYWLNNALRLFDWTDYLEFEQLLDEWILSQQTKGVTVYARIPEGGRVIVDHNNQYE